MKFNSLYKGLLFSFFSILLISLLLTLLLFVATAGRSWRSQVKTTYVERLKNFQGLIQEKLDKTPGQPIGQNEDVIQLFNVLNNMFGLGIWVTGPDGDLVFKTVQSSVGIAPEKMRQCDLVEEGIKLYYLPWRHKAYYAQFPLKSANALNTVHVHFPAERPDRAAMIFIVGLICIGMLIAILIIPLAKMITKRIVSLNQAALEFAGGNLDRRISCLGKDEIAELGNSFNFMADKLEKMIQGHKELTANLSHELRSPLARIRVANELVREHLGQQEQAGIARYLCGIEQEIAILDELIESILKLSKLDIQDTAPTYEQFDFKQVVDVLREQYRPWLEQKKLVCKGTIADGLVLNSDKNKITTMLSNLMDNAVKYTDESGTIEIQAHRPSPERLVFSISNTFRPLSDKELSNLFQPFFRIDKRNNPGSGLGLSIVKKLAQQCRADILVSNSPSGLCFEVRFQG